MWFRILYNWNFVIYMSIVRVVNLRGYSDPNM